MKKSLLVVCILVAFGLSAKSVEAKGGIGIAGGEPSGITLRFNNFPVITFGYSFYSSHLYGTVDYWFLNPKINANLAWYLGGGLTLGFYTGSSWAIPLHAGLRVPIGLQWFPVQNIELYLEGAPGFRVLPDFNFDWQASIGIRFLIW